MKILHIQNGMGPAGNAAYRLSCSMRNYGLDSHVLTLYKCSDFDYVHCHPNARFDLFRKIVNTIICRAKLQDKLPDTYFYRIFPQIGRNLEKNSNVRDADVIYVHWISGAISVSDIHSLIAMDKPVIFFMHDMWDFTGGCHHSFDCTGYTKGCFKCPMFKIGARTPSAQVNNLIKAYANNHKKVAFVSPSRWMAECAKKSLVLRCQKVCCIPNLLDEDNFKPMDKHVAKSLLNLPLDKRIITFGCQAGTGNKYKGWNYLCEAINSINRDDIHIVIYGAGESPETRRLVKFPITFLGRITEEAMLSLICNATDVFVSPSMAESYGLTFMENILCGTPVVGFNNTAIPEIIKRVYVDSCG